MGVFRAMSVAGRYQRLCPHPLGRHVLDDLLLAGTFCQFVLCFDMLPGVDGKDVEDGEGRGHTDSPIRNVQRESVAEDRLSGNFGSGASTAERGLHVHTRRIRSCDGRSRAWTVSIAADAARTAG